MDVSLHIWQICLIQVFRCLTPFSVLFEPLSALTSVRLGMSAQQHRVKKSGSRSSQAQSQSNGHASQVASSQVDFQQNPHERLGTRQGYRNLKAETVGTDAERLEIKRALSY